MIKRTIRTEILIDDASYTLHFSHIPRIGEQVLILEEEGHEEIHGLYRVTDVCWLVSVEDWDSADSNASECVVLTIAKEANQ
jgi:hypothetical protein